MPSKSKQQQKFFGVVKAMQKADIPKKGEAGEVAKDMSKKEVDKYAGTNHKGLPKKVKKETMKISDIKKMVQEELQALNEVKPFVDNRMRKQYDYPKGNKDGIVYLATNDKRYPTEIVLYNQKRDVFHFVYSHDGNFRPGSTKQQTVPRDGFNSTHYVMPYFEEWEEDLGYERGFYENKVTEDNKDDIRFDLVMSDEAYDELYELISKYVEDPDDVYKELDSYDDGGFDSMSNMVTANLDRDKDYIAWKKKYGIKEGKITEAKMTPAKVQKAQRELVATIQLLKKNFPMYKAAKESGDEKKLAKHRDIAVKLTKKKKQLELALDQALGGLYQDAELELKEAPMMQAFPKMKPDKTVRTIAYIRQEIKKIENVQKLKDPAFSKYKNEFLKVDRALTGLANGIHRHASILASEAKLNENNLNEIAINDPVLVAMRAFKTQLKKDKLKPKPKKISMNKYYKLMDMESDLIDQMKDAAKELAQLNSDMNAEAGQKGDAWSDADANRYGGDLDKLQTKYEKLAKQKAKVKKAIMDYRIS